MGDRPSMACCMGLCFVAPKTDSKRFHLQRTDVSNHKPKSVTSPTCCPPGVLRGIEVVTFNGVSDIIDEADFKVDDVDKMISKSPHLVKVEAATWKMPLQPPNAPVCGRLCGSGPIAGFVELFVFVLHRSESSWGGGADVHFGFLKTFKYRTGTMTMMNHADFC